MGIKKLIVGLSFTEKYENMKEDRNDHRVGELMFPLYTILCRSHVTFGFMNPAQMQQASHVQVVDRPNLYSQDDMRKPVPNGVLDHKMVITEIHRFFFFFVFFFF